MNLALGFLILALPTYLFRFQVLGIPMTLLELMIGIIIVVFFVKRAQVSFTKKQPFDASTSSAQAKLRVTQTVKGLVGGLTFSNYKWLMVAIFFVATLAIVFSSDKLAALGIWKAYFVEPMLLFIVIINTVKTKEDFKLLINFLGLSALLISSVAIYQKFSGQFIPNEIWAAEETRRVTSLFGYPNAVGLFLAPVVVLFAGRLVTRKLKFARPLDWCGLKSAMFELVVVGSGAMAIWFARSEGAVVAVLIGLLFLGLLIKRLRIITLSLMVVGVLLFAFVPSVQDLVITKATLSDFSGNIRVIIWQESLQMLSDNPLWGAGLSGFQNVIADYHHSAHIFEIYLYPHNIVLNFWSELGILGLVFFIFLIFKFFYNYIKVKKENGEFYLVLMAVMVAILVHGIVDVPYFKNDLSVLWWVFFAISAILIKRKAIA